MKYTLIASFIACLFITGCDSKDKDTTQVATNQQSQQMPMVTVDVQTVKPINYTINNELNGRTVATDIAEVRPQISGIVESRLFKEGQKVNKGDVLYQIDPATYKAAYEQAVANLKVETAQLKSVKEKAIRYKALVSNGNISKQDSDDATATYEQLLASIDSAKATVDTAKINLDRTTIRAPISGQISISNVSPGALVTADQTDALTTIRELDNIYVNLTQSSTELMKLKQYANNKKEDSINNVSLSFNDGSVYDQKGTLLLSEVNVDESTGSVTLRAIFPNKDHLLLPGMFVRAVVSQGVIHNAYLIPEEGIFHDESGSYYVLVVDNNKVAKRTVTTAGIDNHKYIIKTGLKAGDQVILVNTNKVQIGQSVKTQEYTEDKENVTNV